MDGQDDMDRQVDRSSVGQNERRAGLIERKVES